MALGTSSVDDPNLINILSWFVKIGLYFSGPGTGSFLKYDISNFTPNLSVRVADPNLNIMVSSFVTQSAQTYFVCSQNIPFLHLSEIQVSELTVLVRTF